MNAALLAKSPDLLQPSQSFRRESGEPFHAAKINCIPIVPVGDAQRRPLYFKVLINNIPSACRKRVTERFIDAPAEDLPQFVLARLDRRRRCGRATSALQVFTKFTACQEARLDWRDLGK